MFNSSIFKKLNLETFSELAASSEKVVVYQEIPGDQITPIVAFNALGDETKGAALLESSLMGRLGRYSFLHLNPYFELSAKQGKVTVREESQESVVSKNPIDVLRQAQRKENIAFDNDLCRYTGGLIGFMGYDSVRYFEDIPDRHAGDADTPDIMFRRYRDTIVFDHEHGKVCVATLVAHGGDIDGSYKAAMSRIEALTELLLSDKTLLESERLEGIKKLHSGEKGDDTLDVEMSDEAFKDLVLTAKEYIRQGDVFQVVLSRTFTQPFAQDPFELYRALRLVSPSPYMFYIDAGDYVLAGASPEKQVSLEGDALEVCPLAGTRPRGDQPDSELEKDLLSDAKEKAEHMMLVDLARNDLGRVSRAGSVKVDELMQVQKFSHVMHISSSVSGQCLEQYDAFDILESSFPAGTLSGAPKIRAMEIIDELETSRRGIYGGAVCTIDTEGNLNSCIAIRMAIVRDGIATVRTGAGIVADSDPTAEAMETRHKAQSVLDGLTLATRGL